MSLAELVEKLEGENCFVCKVSSGENTLHVDGIVSPIVGGCPIGSGACQIGGFLLADGNGFF